MFLQNFCTTELELTETLMKKEKITNKCNQGTKKFEIAIENEFESKQHFDQIHTFSENSTLKIK